MSSKSNKGDKVLKMEDVSPELAALIVKNYILPMFESDTKRSLKRKYTKFTSPNNGS